LSNKKYFVLGLLLLLIISAFYFISRSQKHSSNTSEQNYLIAKHIRWRYKVENTTQNELNDVQIKLHTPLAITASQKLDSLTLPEGFSTTVDEYGNNIATLAINSLNPYQVKHLDMRANLLLALSAQDISQSDPQAFLTSTRKIEADHPEIKKLANRLADQKKLTTVKNYYQWVADNLEFSGHVSEDLGALYALEKKSGDSTEYAYLLAALCRANNIPARVIAGYVYAEDAVLRNTAMHNWVEIYIENKWQIADPLKRRFMQKADEYLAFRVVEDTSEFSNSHALISAPDGVSISSR